MNARVVLLGSLLVLSLTSVACRRRRTTGPDPAIRVSVELGGGQDDPAVPTPEFPVTDVFWSSKANELLDASHSLRTVRCPPNGAAGSVWGTDVYTADSSVCTAALHSGLIDLAQGGVVQIVRESPAASYRGSGRNGVRSNGFAAYPAAFRFSRGPRPGLLEEPVDDGAGRTPPAGGPWARTLRDQRGVETADPVVFECPAGGSAHTVWGTDVYTDDSSVCVAAVHAGVITFAQGGTVRAWRGPAQIAFAGSARNGVSTTNYGHFDGSFAFDRAAFARMPRAPEGATAYGWDQSLSTHRAERVLRQRAWCPPNGTAHTVWGTDVYTDDSSVCTAAVHAGLISLERGGTFTVSNAPGRPNYRGAARHGVTSQDYGEFAGSIRLSR